MARLSRPRKKKQVTAEKVNEQPKARPLKEDFWLIAFVCTTIIILGAGYQTMTTPEIGMYGCLIVSMWVLLIKKRRNFSEKIKDMLESVSVVLMVTAFTLFLVSSYYKYAG